MSICTISATAQEKQISLSDIWKNGTFSAESVSGIRSMNDGLHYSTLINSGGYQAIVKYQYKTGKAVDTLYNSAKFTTPEGGIISVEAYHFNADERKILLATNQESIYRRSSKANYYAFDIAKKTSKPITDFGHGKQQLATFSPTENKVAFVRDNNLFISNLDSGNEIQISEDGEWGKIINGAVDWVYEEEFGFHKGFYWSPKGTKIAYYRFDETHVKEFDLKYYNGLYPEIYNFKYPKAGERNAKVDVKIYDLAEGRKLTLNLNSENDQYVPRIKWTQDDDVVSVMRMNRHQNHLEILTADVRDEHPGLLSTKTIYSEQNETYIEINDNLIFLEDGTHFILNSEKDGWNHIYIYNLQGKEVAQLTNGEWEVIDFYGADQKSKKIFFNAAKDNSIGQEVYSVTYDNAISTYKKTKEAYKADGQKTIAALTPNGHTNQAYFSSSFAYFLNFESSAESPNYISVYSANGKNLRDIETNADLKNTLAQFDLNKKEFGSYTTKDGHELNYWMIKPSDFDPAKSYPTMFMIYGGPGSNTVTDSWGGANYFWHEMLSEQGYVIISVDPRGTMRKGRAFKHSTYQQLGKLETEDMIDAAQHFGAMDYIAADRIGIMGWSYGGYMSSLCLTKGAEYFKLGIAVAPVTNWRYYDSIYTERFMRTPQENASGYDDNSPINFVDQMKGHYLLVHGSTDDNVHYQNTMEMITALVEADKQFDLFIYPNKNHGIYGGNTRYHLYTKMTNFIKENL